jgi:hypothetical protein
MCLKFGSRSGTHQNPNQLPSGNKSVEGPKKLYTKKTSKKQWNRGGNPKKGGIQVDTLTPSRTPIQSYSSGDDGHPFMRSVLLRQDSIGCDYVVE